jgi:cell wall-associated NlpC family hydrolase
LRTEATERKGNAAKRFSIFFCGCKQFKSVHNLLSAAKIAIKRRKHAQFSLKYRKKFTRFYLFLSAKVNHSFPMPGKIYVTAVSLVIISFALTSCGAGKTTVAGSKTSTLQDDIVQYGRQYLGKPYRYAGKGPNSFDCSGYTAFVFRKFGYRLDPSSMGQDRQNPTIARKEDLRKGDLVFFEGRLKSGKTEHVGIVTETFSNGHFKFIHSSTSRGVIISSSKEPYFAARYLRGGRVLEENASYVTRRPARKPYPHIAQQPTPENGIIVQTDPPKNPPVSKKNTPRQPKSEMTLNSKPTKIHTVQMGETLYSISRRYGCSVEQLREWNPQTGAVLKAGEKLHILAP